MINRKSVLALALWSVLGGAADADIPDWLIGEWGTRARLTASDGARLRIRCILHGSRSSVSIWIGSLGCATVQGRFEGHWQVRISGSSATGAFTFEGPEGGRFEVTGNLNLAEQVLILRTTEGHEVIFSQGTGEALDVDFNALGPQRLTGGLTFAPR